MYTWGSRFKVILIVLSLALLLAGCNDDDSDVALPSLVNGDSSGETTDPSDPDEGGDVSPPEPSAMLCDSDAPALEAGSRDVTIQSTDIDGNTIDVALSVFTPELVEGECAPVIIKSHGFGGSRLTSLSDVSDDDNAANIATRNAWQSGYFVVTFDQRGFGDTGGSVMVENPGFEGRDTKAVVDYAANNLGGHLASRRGDPVIGALGLSYGGGFQLVGAAVDPRFDAIVPSATWYALPYSLNPNGVPKTVWLDLLVLLGVTGSQGALDPFLYNGFLQSQGGFITDDVIDEVRGNGLNAFCEGMRVDGSGVPDVDAFLVQGVNDTLFNMNEAVRNAQCLRTAGNDVRLLVQRTGHILPLFQDVMGAFGFDLDPTVKCGDTTYDTSERMLSFLDEKLRDMPAEPPVDKNCFVQDDDHGIVTNDIPIGGRNITITEQPFTTGPVVETVVNVLQGLQQNGGLLPEIVQSLGMTVGNLLETVTNLLTNPADIGSILTEDVLKLLPPDLLAELTAPAREIPLFTAEQPMTLAGVPTADLVFSTATDDGEGSEGGAGKAADPIAFVGLGVRRAGDNTGVKLINNQIAPLRGTGEYQQQLVGVSTHLDTGDEVFLLAYGFHNQYFLSFNKIPRAVRLKGSVDLPLTPD